MSDTRRCKFVYLWRGLTFLVLGLWLTACSTAQAKTYTIGIVNLAPTLDPVQVGFKAEMAELGYIEGENVTYIYEGPAGSIDRLEPVIKKLLEENVDLVLAISTPAAQVAQDLTVNTQIPVVFVPIFDPVEAGLAESISQPGHNLTGIRWGIGETRRLELLLELVPSIKQIYAPYNPDDQSSVGSLAIISEVVEKTGVKFITPEVRNSIEISNAITNIPENTDAIFFLPDNLVGAQLDELVTAAKKHKLPLSVVSPKQVEQGALLSYGFDMVLSGHQAAQIVHQILSANGNPAELPVQTTEYVFAVNLSIAEEIGMNIPNDILRQADFIIR